MSKYAALIKAAKEDEPTVQNQAVMADSLPPVQVSGKPDNQIIDQVKTPPKAKANTSHLEDQVNLGVKVPLSWRRHWASESKKTGVTMTEIIVEALTARFGKP